MADFNINDRVLPSKDYPYRRTSRPRRSGSVIDVRIELIRVRWDGFKEPEWLARRFVQRAPDAVEELANDFFERMNPAGQTLVSKEECREFARRHLAGEG